MVAPARSVYDVRLLEPEPGETGRAWLLGTASAVLFGDFFGVSPRVRVEILATETGEPLKDWMVEPDDADLLKRKIDSDLDQMDAGTFAAEWGLPLPPTDSAEDSN